MRKSLMLMIELDNFKFKERLDKLQSMSWKKSLTNYKVDKDS